MTPDPTPRTACPQNPGPCPLCGAHLWPDWKDGFIQWRCDSFRRRDYTICQKPQCVENERDNFKRELAAARERIRALEAALLKVPVARMKADALGWECAACGSVSGITPDGAEIQEQCKPDCWLRPIQETIDSIKS